MLEQVGCCQCLKCWASWAKRHVGVVLGSFGLQRFPAHQRRIDCDQDEFNRRPLEMAGILCGANMCQCDVVWCSQCWLELWCPNERWWKAVRWINATDSLKLARVTRWNQTSLRQAQAAEGYCRHFSLLKQFLQRNGSRIRRISACHLHQNPMCIEV